MCVEHMIKINRNKANRAALVAPRQNTGSKSEEIFLETFICALDIGGGRTIPVRGLLDSGSSISYIDKKLSELIVPREVGKKVRCRVGVFGSAETKFLDVREININIFSTDRKVSRNLNVRSTTYITSPTIRTCPDASVSRQILPANLDYADPTIFNDQSEPIKLLIGNDQIYKFIHDGNLRQLEKGLLLKNSIFGWIPTGPSEIENIHINTSFKPTPVLLNSNTEFFDNKSIFTNELELLNQNLEKLWSLDIIGIRNDDFENEDDLVLQNFRDTTFFENGRYVVRWPWRDRQPKIATNFRMCIARLRSLLSNSTSDLISKYDKLIQEQLAEGIIELAPKNTNFLIHYSPHRAVIKGEKIRVVYDASAKTKSGKSLNDLLYRGPMILENLVGLLINFRLYLIGLTADIEKAFLQLGLNEVDRDVVRFLWIKNIKLPVSSDNLLFLRFARVPFGVISSPMLLNLVIQEILSIIKDPKNEKWLKKVKHEMYVDNFVSSVPDLELASRIYFGLRAKMQEASMNLRDWTSNDNEFLRQHRLPEIDKDSPLISILGINWNRYSDTLSIKMNDIKIEPFVTKRIALSFVASIYDPLGIVNPCILKLRLFIQECWKYCFDWDVPLDANFVARWNKIIRELKFIPKINIPRRYFDHNLKNVTFTLNIFSDASKDAYACAAYLCYRDASGNFGSSLCYSRMRVKPVNKKKIKIPSTTESNEIPIETLENSLTVPRLELMGLLIGKRTSLFLNQQFRIEIASTTLWTDSTIVLQWLQSSDISDLPKFVQHRVSEILRTPNLSIRHVPGNENPADIATRGMSPNELSSCTLWNQGPRWLCHPELWPLTPSTTSVVNTVALSTVKINYTGILTDDFEKSRFKTPWLELVRDFEPLIENTVDLENINDVEKFNVVEKELFRELQTKYFEYELRLLSKNLQPDNNLGLFLDGKGLIRCTGRILNSELPWDTVHPILLPRQSPLVIALVLDLHNQFHHLRISHLMAKVREKYWVCRLRSLAKSTVTYCKACRTVDGGAYTLPPAPHLPYVRVQAASPFLHVGVDLLGPLNVLKAPCAHTNTTETVKIYVALFTCFVTRAVHLEVVDSLSGDDFFSAFNRFTARRGVPLSVTSDNATNFKFIYKLVGIEVESLHKPLADYVTTNRIRWKFIPSYSPWQGGAYERLVTLVKSCIKKTYGLSRLYRNDFVTCLTEIENTLNSRPLTYVSSDEVLTPLTPNHFLRLRAVNTTNVLEISHKLVDADSKNLRQIWNQTQNVLESFWCIFRNLYLTSLRERHAVGKRPPQNAITFQPMIGDIVLVKEPSAPRGAWPLGKIIYLDRRGAVAHVDSDSKTLVRSINQLYPIELTVSGDRPSELSAKLGKDRNIRKPAYLNNN